MRVVVVWVGVGVAWCAGGSRCTARRLSSGTTVAREAVSSADGGCFVVWTSSIAYLVRFVGVARIQRILTLGLGRRSDDARAAVGSDRRRRGTTAHAARAGDIGLLPWRCGLGVQRAAMAAERGDSQQPTETGPDSGQPPCRLGWKPRNTHPFTIPSFFGVRVVSKLRNAPDSSWFRRATALVR